MIRNLLIIIAILAAAPCTTINAQRRDLALARTAVRQGKDLAKTEQTLRDIIAKDTLHKYRAKAYKLLAKAIEAQYKEANKKLYVAQKKGEKSSDKDSAALFDHSLRLVAAMDSISAKPAKQTRRALPNVYAGALFYLHKGDTRQAYSYLDTYLRHLPIWEAASMAVYAAHKNGDADGILRYKDLALGDTAKREYTLRAACEAYHTQGNMPAYLATLKQGAREYPRARYFYPRLIDHYNQHEHPDSALAALDAVLPYDNRPTYQTARLAALYQLERYEQCAEAARQLTAAGDTLSLPYYYAGASLLKLGRHADAMLYFELYRKMEPTKKDKWAAPLYEIYLRLNLGSKFDEIDKIMKG